MTPKLKDILKVEQFFKKEKLVPAQKEEGPTHILELLKQQSETTHTAKNKFQELRKALGQ